MYRQVVDGIKESVAKGLLREGERLPAVRELAAEMMLNPNTVAKAYRELERERVIEVVRGRGTYVALRGDLPDRGERIRHMEDTIKQLLVEAHHLQMTEDDLISLVNQAIAEWKRDGG